ncbi:MAG: hypothetical protein WD100_05525 [Tistlia sp.]|uniref:hypothetical protein n=1 Tax=Tistlia sp. TaxID=3057121 RepID=UPI0034A1D605
MTLRRPAPYNPGMFGLPSIQKLLLLAAIVAAVWYGFKLVGRLSAQRKAEQKLRAGQGGASASDLGRDGGRSRSAARAELKTEEMEACPSCGAYVASGKARSCGRADCPY